MASIARFTGKAVSVLLGMVVVPMVVNLVSTTLIQSRWDRYWAAELRPTEPIERDVILIADAVPTRAVRKALSQAVATALGARSARDGNAALEEAAWANRNWLVLHSETTGAGTLVIVDSRRLRTVIGVPLP
jgi:hypothetical protein